MLINRYYTGNGLRNYDFEIILQNGQVIIVDPSDLGFVKNLKRCDFVFLTHDHHDHIVGLKQLQDRFAPTIYAHSEVNLSGLEFQALHGGEQISIADETFQIDYIPGHIRTHLGFFHEQTKSAFLGDTIFNGGVGNTYSGDVNQLFSTVLKLKSQLKDDFIIYSEHDYWASNLKFTLSIEPDNQIAQDFLKRYESGDYLKTGDFPAVTWGVEKSYNLFLRTHELDVQKLLRHKLDLGDNLSEKDIFIALREKRNQW